MGNVHNDLSQCNLVKVEFLTEKQKLKKDEALRRWEKEQKETEDSDEFSIVKSAEELYDADFRQDIYIPKTLQTIEVGYVTGFFNKIDEQLNQDEEMKYPELAQFVKTQVKSYCLLIDGKVIEDQKYLINMKIAVSTTPVFEFIYKKREFFDRVSRSFVYAVKNWRQAILKKIANFFGLTPVLEAVKSLQKGQTTGAISAIFSRKILSLIGTSLFGPNMLVGGASVMLRTFFPLATPFIFLFRLGSGC